jgi:hypothetical protein
MLLHNFAYLGKIQNVLNIYCILKQKFKKMYKIIFCQVEKLKIYFMGNLIALALSVGYRRYRHTTLLHRRLENN